MVISSSLGAYLSNRSSMLEPDALLALPGGSERRAANEEKHGAFTAESVLSCCERDSAENMPLGEMVSRRFREERAGRAGQKSGRVRQEASAVRRALRRGKTVSSSSSRPAAVHGEIFLKVSTFEGAWLALASRRVMSYTDSQTAKIATLTFVTGVAVGFVLNNRLRRWLNGY